MAAEEWLKQRRSHRGYSGQMDDVLEKLYFPCGRSGEASDVEVDNIENYGDDAAIRCNSEYQNTSDMLHLEEETALLGTSYQHSPM